MQKIEKGVLLNKYRIFETNNFLKCLKKLNKHNKQFIENRLSAIVYAQLKKEPHFGTNIKKLRNWKPETWRYRIADYRFFYEIADENLIVSIITVADRKNAYH